MMLRAAPGWPVEAGAVRWRVSAALLGLLGAQVLSVVWLVLAAGALYGGDGIPPADERPIWTLPLLNLGLWVGYLAAPLVARRLTASASMGDFELRAPLRDLATGAVLGVVSQLLLLPLLYLVVLWLVDGDPGAPAERLVDRVQGPVDAVVLVVAVVAIAPFVEEWFYRGMLLPTLVRGLRSVGARWAGPAGVGTAAVISAALFAIVHQDWILFPGLFLFALVLAVLTISTGRLGPAVAAHVAFNATTVVQLLILA